MTGIDNAKGSRRPGLLRRLAAMVYDALVAFAVLFVADAALIVPAQGWLHIENLAGRWWFLAYEIGVVVLFFTWFWSHGGQTLGMRAWRLKVVRADGAPLKFADALRRFAAAVLSWLPAGLGFLWALVDRQGLTWHDRLSRTRLVLVEKTPK
ncbi:MAG: RDD family protein [Pseudomonadota bacterium]